ncbi:MAG: YebC/PmpR family DNA-binding transcriptional regulator, partial [Alphaproteobacteria bacterium HGW-Alphaproteobacteria-12]
ELYTAADALHEVAGALEAKFGESRAARIVWKPQNTIELDDEKAETVLKMLEALDDNDDVQQVYANFEMSDSVLEKMSA